MKDIAGPAPSFLRRNAFALAFVAALLAGWSVVVVWATHDISLQDEICACQPDRSHFTF